MRAIPYTRISNRSAVSPNTTNAVGDGALGFRSALEEEFQGTEQQRCWIHKTADILDKLSQSVRLDAKKKGFTMGIFPAGKFHQVVCIVFAILK